jgi:hypothetical protein
MLGRHGNVSCALVPQLYLEAVAQFQEFLLAAMDAELRSALLGMEVRTGRAVAACSWTGQCHA